MFAALLALGHTSDSSSDRDGRTCFIPVPPLMPRHLCHACRNVKQYPEAEPVDGMLLMRIDAPMYFANVSPVRDSLARHEAKALVQANARGTEIHFIIIDLAPVIDIDASAVHFFTVSCQLLSAVLSVCLSSLCPALLQLIWCQEREFVQEGACMPSFLIAFHVHTSQCVQRSCHQAFYGSVHTNRLSSICRQNPTAMSTSSPYWPHLLARSAPCTLSIAYYPWLSPNTNIPSRNCCTYDVLKGHHSRMCRTDSVQSQLRNMPC